MNIRLRLTLWYTAIFSLILVIFSFAVYTGLSRSLFNTIDNHLQREVGEILGNLEFEEGEFEDDEEDEYEQHTELRYIPEEGVYWRILDEQGRPIIDTGYFDGASIESSQVNLDTATIQYATLADGTPVRFYSAPFVIENHAEITVYYVKLLVERKLAKIVFWGEIGTKQGVPMGYTPQTADDIRQNLAEQLDWRFAERNDQAVAQALSKGEAIDAVYTANEAELLGGFFDFLQETGIIVFWRAFRIEGVQRTFQPAIYFVLLYGTRVLFGIESTNALPGLLFSNLAVMSLIGFTSWQVWRGLSDRGKFRRGQSSPYVLMDPQTLAETISKASAKELEKLFNGTIHCLAAFGVFVAEAMVVVDGTPIETTARYQGRGCQKVEEKRRAKKGLKVTLVKFVFGWRLIALVDLATLSPLAIKIVQIQEHEAPYLLELVKQAQANLAPYSRIRWLVVDRAYVDGKSLYELNQMNIQFVVIAKSNMVARQTALEMKGQVNHYVRTEIKRHGHGRFQWQEKLYTRIYAVTDIRDWAAYRPPVVPDRPLRRQARPTLNAVVVETWNNQSPSAVGTRVYLTNAPVDNPWSIVNLYDDRSWIENGLFRNSKQFWRLTRWFPKKNEAGVRSHLTFVMLINAVTTTYRLWQKAQADAPHQVDDHQISRVDYHLIDIETGEIIEVTLPSNSNPTHLASSIPLHTGQQDNDENEPLSSDLLAHSLLGGQGILRWQRELTQQRRDKVIVFIGNHYGIFNIYDLLVLVGVTFNHTPLHLDPPDEVLRRYECHPPSRAGPT